MLRTLSPEAVGATGRCKGPARHNLGVLSLVCFVTGGLLGWGAAQAGEGVRRVWPVVLLVQILATSATLSLAAAARKSTAVALGLRAGDRTVVRVVATARDECDALDARAALKTIITQLSNEDETGALVAKLFAQTTVSRDGSVVKAHGEVKGNLLRRLIDPDAER